MKYIKKMLTISFFILSMLLFANRVDAAEEKIVITYKDDEKIHGYIEKTIEKQEVLSINKSIFNAELITNADINMQYANQYYYNQLTNEIARITYNTLKTDTSGKGEVSVPIYKEYNIDVSKKDDDSYIQSFTDDKIYKYVFDAFQAFINDNPSIYWYYSTSAYVNLDIIGEKIWYDDLIITSKIQEKNNYRTYNTRLNEVADSITGENVYELVKKCHDYICNTVSYTVNENSEIDQTAYDALINKKGVCEAQAQLFTALCRKKNIICITVDGKAKNDNKMEPHTWNYIYHPDEEKWYAVDVTWDNVENTRYIYFLVGKNTKVLNDLTFAQDHTQGYQFYKSQTFVQSAPELSNDKYEEFAVVIVKNTNNRTSEPVKVTAEFNREVREVSGWILSEDRKTMSKTYQENIEEKIEVTNFRGEKLVMEIDVNNIDKIPPTLKVKYTTKEITNQNVQVEIQGNERLSKIEGWNLLGDCITLIKTYEENTTENIIVKDLAGNTTEVLVEIKNIDKIAPTIKSVEGNATEWTKNNVTLKVNAEDKQSGLSNEAYSFDGGDTWQSSNEKEYTENTEKIAIKVKDNAGNIVEYETISISKIERLTEIRIKKEPDNKEYLEGQDFDNTGMIIEAKYNNGTTEEVNDYRVENGKCLKLGQTSVTISYTEKGVTKTIEVKGLMVTRKEKLTVELGRYTIEEENDVKYLEKILPETSIENFKKEIKTNGTIEIYKGNEKIIGESMLIGTGMEIVIKLNEEEAKYTVVVTGDLIGNGKMGIGDLSKLARYAARIDTDIRGAYLRASDIVKDGKYGRISDISKMARVLAGMDQL